MRAFATVLVTGSPAVALAQPHIALPPVNIGGTSFMDGLGGPGLMNRLPLQLYVAPRTVGPEGRALPGNNRLVSYSATAHAVYSPSTKFFDSYWGFEVLLPAAHIDLTTPSGKASATGVGDLIVSLFFLQLPDMTLLGGKLFHRLDITAVVPTGQYDRNAPVSVGSHLWSVNPYYAFTWLFHERIETSWRLQYLWNSVNGEPAPGIEARTVQPGQAVFFNGAASFELIAPLRTGVAGYFLQQITDARADGRGVPRSKERVAALGPGLFMMEGTTQVIANAYWEFAVENRPMGARVNLQLLHVW
ncbi:MAG TPA: transporter [Polyangiaceae bacterium]|jgi:hypothetical protein|nr:transporter [Polyangiaceae bacterium]